MVHEQIWKQCLGEIELDGVVPDQIIEPMELGFEFPFKLTGGDPKTPKKKLYEVDVKRQLMQSINASLGRLQV